jgi:hypothetical protein
LILAWVVISSKSRADISSGIWTVSSTKPTYPGPD